MKNLFLDVVEFQKKFGLKQSCHPTLSEHEYRDHRASFLQEEVNEFREAILLGDLPKAADALVDIVYVALGTADGMGLPFNALWDDVHRANMSKERGIGPRGYEVDVIKPEGWVGPQTEDILLKYGWSPPWLTLTIAAGTIPHILREGIFITERPDFVVGRLMKLIEVGGVEKILRITARGVYDQDEDNTYYYYSVVDPSTLVEVIDHHPV